MTCISDLWPTGERDIVELDADADLWQLHQAGLWVVIPTNMRRTKTGAAVMGAGLAKDAARRFPDVPARYGTSLTLGSARVVFSDHRLLLCPTKDHWRDAATMALVTRLLKDVAIFADSHAEVAIALPAPGCGLGGLPWSKVRAAARHELAGRRVALLPPRTASRPAPAGR